MSNPLHSIRLLVNADDFGLHADINRGISECVERGRVQSVSFSATGQVVEWKKLQEWSREGVLIGLHVTLVGEPWTSDGRILPGWKDLAGRLLFQGRSIRDDVNREIERQFQLCADNGLDPDTLSHVDSHQHVHVLNGVWQPCIDLAREYGIPRIRVPSCPSWRVIKRSFGGVALQVISRRRAAEREGSLPCLGLAHAGRNTVATFSHELNCAARAAEITAHRAMELVVHPGVNTPGLEAKYADWRFNWTAERDALLSPQFAEAVEAAGYTFSDRTKTSQPNPNSVSD
jgi:predicted glycoside hydrolase/deacetylase ChbG (UPF0249 family)